MSKGSLALLVEPGRDLGDYNVRIAVLHDRPMKLADSQSYALTPRKRAAQPGSKAMGLVTEWHAGAWTRFTGGSKGFVCRDAQARRIAKAAIKAAE